MLAIIHASFIIMVTLEACRGKADLAPSFTVCYSRCHFVIFLCISSNAFSSLILSCTIVKVDSHACSNAEQFPTELGAYLASLASTLSLSSYHSNITLNISSCLLFRFPPHASSYHISTQCGLSRHHLSCSNGTRACFGNYGTIGEGSW